MYKILVFKNHLKIDIEPELTKALKYFYSRVPFQLTFASQEINIPVQIAPYSTFNGFDSTTGQPALVSLYGPTMAVEDAVRALVPPNTYHAVIFAWDIGSVPAQKNGIITSQTLSTPLYPDTEFIQLATSQELQTNPFADYVYIGIIHELIHTFTKRLVRKGINVLDEMDVTIVKGVPTSYYKNDQPEDPDSNYSRTLRNLAPFFSKLDTPMTPTVTLVRVQDDGVQTLGTLLAGTFSCKTLERSWKQNQKNISAIPKGTYQVKWTLSMKFMKYTYEIQNVPGRSGIRIHSANFWRDLEGCIALGSSYVDLDKDGKVDIINSRITVKAFEDAMNRKPFTLIIK